mmetsp:Transcript_25852/g.65177  ORF Transcript_25852/g.65177 Transcript_25852/m.65177 type:complete len:83 (+) Transcript_25852:124-372(+)
MWGGQGLLSFVFDVFLDKRTQPQDSTQNSIESMSCNCSLVMMWPQYSECENFSMLPCILIKRKCEDEEKCTKASLRMRSAKV